LLPLYFWCCCLSFLTEILQPIAKSGLNRKKVQN
jgi:hypothetical protein